MSVCIVKLREPYSSGPDKNRELRALARLFGGSIFHTEAAEGSFIVRPVNGKSEQEQIDEIRTHFEVAGMFRVMEVKNRTGQLVFDVELIEKPPITLFIERQCAYHHAA